MNAIDMGSELRSRDAEIKVQAAEIDRLRAALEVFADSNSWSPWSNNTRWALGAYRDGDHPAAFARAALSDEPTITPPGEAVQ